MIKKLEEISMNAWPGLQTIVVEGWIVRFANGITRRSNSVIPLSCSTEDVEGNIDFCESLYEKRNLRTAFKMTSACCPGNLDEILDNRNYVREAETSVQTLDISNRNFDNLRETIFDSEVNEQWLLDFIKLSGHNLNRYDTFYKIIDCIVLDKCLLSILINGKPAGVGLGIRQDKFVGLFDIVVHENFRKKGFGKTIVNSILKWGKSLGAETAYLQVMTDNPPALNLYSKLGFKELYKYWYRIKE